MLPESAFPVFAHQVPRATIETLAETMQRRQGDVLLGVFVARPPSDGETQPHIHKASCRSARRRPLYRKRHLVPFGERSPRRRWSAAIESVLAIPLSDQTPGPADQPPFALAGERLAVHICYEDAFGSELASWSRDATMLVNMTNDAWYGRSIAAWQHNQIAAMRAKETGKPMLRATNTGITSVIDADGAIRVQLPWFRRGVLETTVAGRTGETPFVRFGNMPVVIASLALLVLAWALGRSGNAAVGDRRA